MPQPPDADDWLLGADGGDEVVVVPWPRLLRDRLAGKRDRLAGKVERSDRQQWWVLWTVLAGLLATNVTFTILVVALPRIADGLDTSTNTLTWVFTGPLLAFGVAAPTLGKLGDLVGHRRVYLVSLAFAAACYLVSALSVDAGMLIVSRTLEAIAGAGAGSASAALIFSVFDRHDRVKAMGWWSLVGAGGPVLGVAIGGPLVESVGWRVIFAAQVPLTLAALALAVVILPDTPRRGRPRLDWGGAVTLTVGVTSLLFGMNQGPEAGWAHPTVVGSLVVAPLALAAFVAVERRVAEPLLPLRYLRRRNFAFPIAAQFFSQFGYMGGFILAPALLDEVFHYSESKIGLIVIARPIAFSISSPIAGYLAVRLGERIASVAGTAAVAVSLVMMAGLGPSSSLVAIAAALAVSGIGLGVCSPSLVASVANAVEQGNLGIATATQQLVAQVGVVAGIQVFQTVQHAREGTSGLVGSFGDAYTIGAVVCLLGVACAAFVRRADRRTPNPTDEVAVLSH